ncbi:hypothetical protein TNCV_3666971 [Trichonephila clavipes]|nr:hypothetical protein TNCV_3666971 [Trichonephila clavipes]
MMRPSQKTYAAGKRGFYRPALFDFAFVKCFVLSPLNPQSIPFEKNVSAFAAKSTLNSHRAASPLVRFVEGKERWEAPGQPQVVPLVEFE